MGERPGLGPEAGYGERALYLTVLQDEIHRIVRKLCYSFFDGENGGCRIAGKEV